MGKAIYYRKRAKKSNKVKPQGSQLVAIVNCDSAKEEGGDEEGVVQEEIMVVELLGGKPYTCPTLTPVKGKEKIKTKEKEVHLFNISKADQIFDFLVKDK